MTIARKPVDWGSLSLVWEFFETRGLQLDDLLQLQSYLHSPVLIVGGGAGLIPSGLVELGYEVLAWDQSEDMVKRAWQNMRVKMCHVFWPGTCTIAASRKTIDLSTVIISTSVIENIWHYNPRYLDTCFSDLNHFLAAGGTAIIALEQIDERREIFEDLLKLGRSDGIDSRLMRSSSLAESRENLQETGIPAEDLERLYKEYSDLLLLRIHFLHRLGKRLDQLGEDPERWVDENLVYHSGALSLSAIKSIDQKALSFGLQIAESVFCSERLVHVWLLKLSDRSV